MQQENLKNARLLIVDDEVANVRLLERLFERGGYSNYKGTTDSRLAVGLFQEFQPDLILLDLLMPHLDGFAVLEQLKPMIPEGTYLPVLVLTADVSQETKRRALAAGAKDFVIKPFDVTEVLLRVRNLLETRFLYLEIRAQNELLEQRVQERTEQLLQAEKLATLGELIAGIAHELNNPLSAMMGHAQLLRMNHKDPATAARVDKLLEAAQRATRIVRNFLTFARRHKSEKVAVSINEVVTKTLEFLAYQLRVANVEVQTALAPDLPTIAGDPHQLQQVLINLVNNACQAVAAANGRGTLRVASGLGPDRATIRITVADDGPGIPSDHLARIFEPFFTTKPAGQGTGLGLPIAKGIVAEHGGAIEVESEPGRGTTFVLTLPVSDAAPVPLASVEPRAISPGLRVLVVDDETAVRDLIAEALAAQGSRVQTAASGRETLEVLASSPADVLVLDVTMPEMTGAELWNQIKGKDPALARRTVFCTGDVAREEVRAFLEATGCPLVRKPFEFRQLFDAVAHAASR